MASGELLEYHSDLFKHEFMTCRTGVSKKAIHEVIHDGKLPLLQMESEGLGMIKGGGVDCLSIFLMPPSVEVFRERLEAWLSEGEGDVLVRGGVGKEGERRGGKAVFCLCEREYERLVFCVFVCVCVCARARVRSPLAPLLPTVPCFLPSPSLNFFLCPPSRPVCSWPGS